MTQPIPSTAERRPPCNQVTARYTARSAWTTSTADKIGLYLSTESGIIFVSIPVTLWHSFAHAEKDGNGNPFPQPPENSGIILERDAKGTPHLRNYPCHRGRSARPAHVLVVKEGEPAPFTPLPLVDPEDTRIRVCTPVSELLAEHREKGTSIAVLAHRVGLNAATLRTSFASLTNFSPQNQRVCLRSGIPYPDRIKRTGCSRHDSDRASG
jgi:hypothetical protein